MFEKTKLAQNKTQNAQELENQINDLIEAKPENISILLTTGETEETNKMNIYDLAGNIWEWNLEKASTNREPCTHRGGDYGDSGSTYTASGYSSYQPYNTSVRLGARSTLF